MARQEKTIHYIYKTICLVTNRYYIGMHSTCNIEDGYMGSGKRLRRSIRKHGVENHVREILEFFENRELLIEGEKKAITEDMITDTNCMNLKGGGEGGFISKEHKEKARASAIKNFIYKIKNDKDFKNKISKTLLDNVKNAHKNGKYKYGGFTNKKHSEESKQLMSESSKGVGSGETNSQYGTCWITMDGINKKIKKENLVSYIEQGWIKGRK